MSALNSEHSESASVTLIALRFRAAAALEKGDYTTMGKLMRASHDSLQSDYEASALYPA